MEKVVDAVPEPKVLFGNDFTLVAVRLSAREDQARSGSQADDHGDGSTARLGGRGLDEARGSLAEGSEEAMHILGRCGDVCP